MVGNQRPVSQLWVSDDAFISSLISTRDTYIRFYLGSREFSLLINFRISLTEALGWKIL